MWTKVNANRWRAEVDGKVLVVNRKRVTRTHTVRTGIMGWQKYRASSSTNLCSPIVIHGNDVYHLGTCGSLKDAQAAALRFAQTGEGRMFLHDVLTD